MNTYIEYTYTENKSNQHNKYIIDNILRSRLIPITYPFIP